MKNVNDLNRTNKVAKGPQTQQTISLSTFNENPNRPVDIDIVGGVNGISEDTEKRPTIRVNPGKPPRKPSHRSTVDPTNYAEINNDEINTMIPQKPKKMPKLKSDVAFEELDKAVNRKREEYKNFINQAVKDDAANRELVEDGLATVNDEEYRYMPTEVYEGMKESDKIHTNESEHDEDDFIDDINDYARDIDRSEQTDEYDDNEYDGSNVVINNNPFEFEDDDDYGTSLEERPTMKSNNYDIDDDEEDYDYDEDTDEIEDEESNDQIVDEYDNDEDYEFDESSSEVEEYIDDSDDVEKEIEEEPSFSNNALKITKSVNIEEANVTTSDFDTDDDDFEDVSFETDENLTDEQINKISEDAEKHLRSEILKKIVNTGKKLDTTTLSVSNKVINLNSVLQTMKKKPETTATWPLTFAGRPYIASALKGPDIAIMSDMDTSANSGVGLSMAQARIMFEHDASPYRPTTLEAWAKTIPYADVENIFAALYMSSIKDANYIPRTCPKESCQYSYLEESQNIMSMAKFKTDKARENFDKIKNMKLTADMTTSYETVVSVINDTFAIGLKLPSIYTVLFEYDSLNAEFVKKYAAMSSIVQYIDYIYMIDPETQSLRPISWKKYPGDYEKTFKSKISTYSKLIKELDDSDFTVMMALINSMITKASELKYVSFEVPETKCPKCGAIIKARPITARGLVFTRQRLVELATTPTAR